MSPSKATSARRLQERAQIFAALGDQTRLELVRVLADGEAHSIAELSEDSPLSRQAISKHLRVLEDVGIVHSQKSGRYALFRLDPKPMDEMQSYITELTLMWDQRLTRLKNFLEDDD